LYSWFEIWDSNLILCLNKQFNVGFFSALVFIRHKDGKILEHRDMHMDYELENQSFHESNPKGQWRCRKFKVYIKNIIHVSIVAEMCVIFYNQGHILVPDPSDSLTTKPITSVLLLLWLYYHQTQPLTW